MHWAKSSRRSTPARAHCRRTARLAGACTYVMYTNVRCEREKTHATRYDQEGTADARNNTQQNQRNSIIIDETCLLCSEATELKSPTCSLHLRSITQQNVFAMLRSYISGTQITTCLLCSEAISTERYNSAEFKIPTCLLCSENSNHQRVCYAMLTEAKCRTTCDDMMYFVLPMPHDPRDPFVPPTFQTTDLPSMLRD